MKKIKGSLLLVFIFAIIGASIDSIIGFDNNHVITTIFFIMGIVFATFKSAISQGIFNKIKKENEELNKKLSIKQLKPLELDKLIESKTNELNELIKSKESDLKNINENITNSQNELNNIIDKNNKIREKENQKYKQLISELNKSKSNIETEIAKKQDILTSIIKQLDNYGEKVSLQESISNDKAELKRLSRQITELKEQITSYDDQINIESYGLYTPHYSFTSSKEYNEKLNNIRDLQRSLIRENKAGDITLKILFDNSESEGRKMQLENIKQLVRTFNVECEAAINKVTLSNMKMIENRISRSFKTLNNLNKRNYIILSEKYLNLKLDELHLAFEYSQKKEEEKEILREEREKEREERKAQAEIIKQRKAIEQERKKQAEHYKQAEALLKEKMKDVNENDERFKSLQSEVVRLKQQLVELNKKEESLDYRENHSTAGYVYIISNIGAFGENVFKIGVTRRLEPLDRIKELSSASVPFKFDVHALIFSDDAYKLETNLHNYFSKYRVNKVNDRKEFFGISIEQVKEALDKYYNRTFDFHEIPEAEEYRKSKELANQ